MAIPVLAGSAAYAVTEIFGWKEGLDKSFRQAKAFYIVITASTLVGFAMNLMNINPFKALFYTAVIYGLMAPILIGIVMILANNKNLMGNKTNGRTTNILGGITFALMSAAAVGFFLTL